MKTKIISTLALICTVVQGTWAQNFDVWDGVTLTKPKEIDGCIHIRKAAELAYIRSNYKIEEWNQITYYEYEFGFPTQQTSAKTPYDTPISLDADIDMGDAESWIPLGWSQLWSWSENHYNSTFNGNGHTIRIHTSGATDNYQGLFSGIASNGRVENLHVVADIHCSTSRLVGGIAGENDGTIENCWVSGLVSSDWHESSSSYDGKVGGIAGENNGTVQYCCVTADVQNDDADVGGLLGNNDNGTIQHCTFYGSVISEHSQDSKYVGDTGTESDLYDTYNQSEFNTASGKDMYRKAIRYTYDVAVIIEGHGTIRTWADNEYDVSGTRNGLTFSLNATSGTVLSITITDDDGNNVSVSGNQASGYTFTMPKKNVTATVDFDFTDWPRHGTGTEKDPYIISSTDDWQDFAHNVNLGRSYNGNYVKLTNNISVTNSVGRCNLATDADYKPFSGTFDGDGHTLTINLSNQSRFGAPFKCVDGATIMNLRTAGRIDGSGNENGKLLSGLVGVSFGNTTITGCISSVTLSTDFGVRVNIDAALAGFVAGTVGGSLTISGCVFDGSMTGKDNQRCAGISGYEYSDVGKGSTTTIISNCLFAPATLTVSTADDGYTKTFSRDPDATITNCYYTQTLGTAQGTQCILAASIPTNLGSPTAEYGMVTAYQNGLIFDGTFYGGFTIFSLANTGNNATTISNTDGYLANVTLAGRTLYKDGYWNTICLPFNLTLSNSPLDGAVARPLTSASISGSTLNLTFGDAVTTLQAGTPYIIKWTSAAVTGSNTAISGSQTSYAYLVDGNTETEWNTSPEAPWVCVFKTASVVNVKGYTLVPHNSSDWLNPTIWTLEAKLNEGDTWTTIDSRDVTTNSSDALPDTDVESKIYDISAGKQGQYQYFRFTVTLTRPDYYYMRLGELKLYGDLVSPVFNGVPIDASQHYYDSYESDVITDERVRFMGTYESMTFDAEDRSILLMGGSNTLYYPTTGAGLGAQRAYFKIGTNSAQFAPGRITSFCINFGDSGTTTGVIAVDTSEPKINDSDAWYNIYGIKLDGKPTQKGLYINNGIKVVIE